MIKDQVFPLVLADGNKFGRYPKISREATFNMLVSDGWLVPTAGYVIALSLLPSGTGRGIFSSTNSKSIIAVVNEKVYKINDLLQVEIVGSLETAVGDVFIDENNANQIGICDKLNIYIYDYTSGQPAVFEKADINFVPLYLTFQDTYFIAPEQDRSVWRLSENNNGFSWPADANHEGTFQTKTDKPLACVKVPGKGSHLFVMGSTVTESWVDVGYFKFPYQRTSSFNIDYGCVSSSTIAYGETFVVWLGRNEKTGPIIVYSSGGESETISSDGVNFLMSNLKSPEKSYGFMVNQDGHLLYYLSFIDPADNITLIYDFNTGKFFFGTDYKEGHFPAKRVAFFDDSYYFVSFDTGALYKFDASIYTYDGFVSNSEVYRHEIPRIKITSNFRFPDNDPFIGKELTFPVEQGNFRAKRRIDLSISRDGGETYGNTVSVDMTPMGKRVNKVWFRDFGMANELTFQLRFWGKDRFVIGNGSWSAYR